MNSVFTTFGFFASGFGMLSIGTIAALTILIWDWRASLLGLVMIQFGVATVMVLTHNVVPQWAVVQTLITMLCSLILALSGNQVQVSRTLHQAGNWLMRILALIMLIISWQIFDIQIPLPLINARISVLFVWLAVCALLTLSLSDNPLFTGAALLLWFIPVQAVTMVLTPIPGLIAILGALQLFLALSASYLILTEGYATIEHEPVTLTDITFPQSRPLLPSFHPADPDGDLPFTELPTIELPALPAAAERTGEHPLVERLNRRKRAAQTPVNKRSQTTARELPSTPDSAEERRAEP